MSSDVWIFENFQDCQRISVQIASANYFSTSVKLVSEFCTVPKMEVRLVFILLTCSILFFQFWGGIPVGEAHCAYSVQGKPAKPEPCGAIRLVNRRPILTMLNLVMFPGCVLSCFVCLS